MQKEHHIIIFARKQTRMFHRNEKGRMNDEKASRCFHHCSEYFTDSIFLFIRLTNFCDFRFI